MLNKLWNHFKSDSLFRNSVYLMLSTGVMGFLGFFFWIINARLFTTEQIGLATTLVSVTGIVTSFSLLGFDIGLIRYLPKAKRRDELINTCFLIVIVAALVTSTIFLIGLEKLTPKLLFVKNSPIYSFLFILFIVFSSASSLIENVFISFREARIVLIKSTIFSAIKLALPFFLITLGAYGIFSSWMVAVAVSFIVSLIILVAKFSYRPKLNFSREVISEIGRFSFGNYISGFLVNLPNLALPIIITNRKGPETTAYYYMAMMIITMLFIVPQAVSQSFFAEGSYNEFRLKELVWKACKTITSILIPAIILTLLLGNSVLLFFGKIYSAEGLKFLQILAISSVFVSINSLFSAILKIKHEIKKLIFINLLTTVAILGLSLFLIEYGLPGAGLAWVLGQSFSSILYLVFTKPDFLFRDN